MHDTSILRALLMDKDKIFKFELLLIELIYNAKTQVSVKNQHSAAINEIRNDLLHRT